MSLQDRGQEALLLGSGLQRGPLHFFSCESLCDSKKSKLLCISPAPSCKNKKNPIKYTYLAAYIYEAPTCRSVTMPTTFTTVTPPSLAENLLGSDVPVGFTDEETEALSCLSKLPELVSGATRTCLSLGDAPPRATPLLGFHRNTWAPGTLPPPSV